jgi:DNA-binding transcriptional MerR regulator
MSEKPRAFRSGELARAVGISTDSLRHYERLGVLALQLGFTLPELAEILRIRDRGGAPCRRVLGMLEKKLHVLQERIAELQQTQRYMESMVSEWRARISQSQSGEKAFLLRSLNGAPAPATVSREPLRRKKRR